MAKDREITSERELIKGFQDIATAYQEISLYTMQKVRTSILRNREFLEELSEIFFDVKMSYMNMLPLLLHHRVKEGILQGKKNGKAIDVLITSNTHLIGSLSQRVFDTFYQNIQQDTADIFIIGNVGKELFDEKKIKRTYAYFALPDDNKKVSDIAPIIEHILLYEKVNVYYGKFVNVLTQQPTKENISGDQPLESTKDNEKVFHFLFEPKLEDILAFFQTQVVTSLMNQSIHEGELAHHASRITTMEEALRQAEIILKQLDKQAKKFTEEKENKKQLQLLSSMQLWTI